MSDREHVNPAAAQAPLPPPILTRLGDVDWQIITLLQTLVRAIVEQHKEITQMSKSIQELIDSARQTEALIRANADLDQSIYQALKDRDDRLTAALDQLRNAGTDQAKLDELADALQAAHDAATGERDATVAAIKASTPASGLGAPVTNEPVHVNPAAAQAEPPPSPQPAVPQPPAPNPEPEESSNPAEAPAAPVAVEGDPNVGEAVAEGRPLPAVELPTETPTISPPEAELPPRPPVD